MLGIVTSDCEGIMFVSVVNINVKDCFDGRRVKLLQKFLGVYFQFFVLVLEWPICLTLEHPRFTSKRGKALKDIF